MGNFSIIRTTFILVIMLITNNIFAEVGPIEVLEQATGNVTKEMRKNKDKIAKNPDLMFDIIDEHIMPIVDFAEMARWVCGKTIWGKSTEEQKNQFVHQFKILVVRTYVSALKKYTDEKIEFSPINKTKAKRIEVQSKVLRKGKDDIQLKYRLINTNQQWKVYDLVVEGVSILQGFQAQFSDRVRRDGIQVVTEYIKQHNSGKPHG